MITDRHLARHFWSTQQSPADGELENAYWIPVTGSPAVGLTKLRSEMGLFLAPLETGRSSLGFCVPLGGWRPGSDAFSLSLTVGEAFVACSQF